MKGRIQMTTDKPYWEQDIAECLRVAAESIGPVPSAEFADGNMAETLREVVDRLADAELANGNRMGTFSAERGAYKRVAIAAIRAALAKPSESMLTAGALLPDGNRWSKIDRVITTNRAGAAWNAMAAKRLEELG